MSAVNVTQQAEQFYVIRCGAFFVGAHDHSRVGSIERARRLHKAEADDLLSKLLRADAPFPLPWSIEPVEGGAR